MTMKKEAGLNTKEVHKKLQQYGFNEIKESAFASPLKILFRQIRKNLIIYLLFAAMLISFFVGKTITGYTLLAVIIVVTFVGFIQEYRAEKVIQSLKKMLTPISIVIRDGKEKEIPSREIVPGDVIVLRSGEKIPVDCIVLEEKELLVNESILTGESSEVEKKAVKNPKDYSDKNVLFMGSFIMNGRCIAKAIHTGMNTKFGKIAGMISTAEKELPLQNKTNKIAKYMVFAAIIFSVLTGLIMVLRGPHSETFLVDVLILVIALSVSAFPEGLPVVLITALSTGVHRMAKNNAIVNRMSIIETLGETTVICADKTGTITKGEMTVKKILFDNKLTNVSGVGYESEGEFFINNKKIDTQKEPVLDLLLKAGIMCNDSRITRTGEDNIYNISGSPTEASLLIMAAKNKLFKEDLKFTRIEEIPFNSERKIMSVLCRFENKNYVYSKGAPEILLEKCNYIQRHDGIFTLSDREKKRILDINKEMTFKTFRTLALAYKKIDSTDKDHFENELVFLGIVGIEDPAREEVKESILLCKKAGIKVKMITGDNKETALAIAKEIGLSGKILEGKDLDKITDEELSDIVQDIVIFARVKPEHKLKIVKALKANKEIVTMTGDGVNDAPALKEAHIGVAMGKGGTDVSRSVADLTLKDNNFSTIVTAIREGRTIFKNIRKFTSYQLSCNYSELAVLFIGVLFAPLLGWIVPILLALQILFMNLITDDLPAITLSLNKSSKDIMLEKPRKKKDILNKSLIIWMMIAGLSMAIFTLISFFVSFNVFHQSVEVARTTALLSLILLEIANAFNFRSFRKGVLNRPLFTNKYLVYASIISLLTTILIIYTPLNKIFSTVPVSWANWLIAFVLALLIILLFDFLKMINKKKKFFKLEGF